MPDEETTFLPEGLDLRGAKILIVDDDPVNLDVLCQTLETAGYELSVAPNGEIALTIAQAMMFDLILLDVLMPDLDGFEVCRRLKHLAATRDIPVIFLTAKGGMEEIVKGFQVGGVDYIVKPFYVEEVLARVATQLKLSGLTKALAQHNRVLAHKNEELARINRDLERVIAQRETMQTERNHLSDQLAMLAHFETERWGIDGLIGQSPTMHAILKEINLLRNAGTIRVLITGESGTGKELIARAIHAGSPRRQGPFIPVNCSAVPRDLAESLFFGHHRGAFTGATQDRRGYFELAHNGTLFLDEVGDMPLDIQPKLLRVLEDHVILPLGATQEKQVAVRVLAASNQDLQAKVATGEFREELYFRLAQFTVVVPPLRDRHADIVLLANHFLRLFSNEMAIPVPVLTPEALALLQSYPFPGNVRELKNIIERGILECGGASIRPEHLHILHPPFARTSPPASIGPSDRVHPFSVNDLPLNLEQAEVLLIHRALEQTKGNIAAAASLLGTTRPKLYRVLDKYPHPLYTRGV